MSLPAASPAWTLHPNDLLAFVRPAQGAEPERLLLARLAFCPEKACMCREVGLRSLEVDDVALGAAPPEDLAARLARGPTLASLLELDFGTVTPDPLEGRAPLTAEWLAFLREAVDGALLDRLHARWMAQKGLTLPPPDLTSLDEDPGLFVGWQGSQPDLRDDGYLVEERPFLADELFCLAPGCTCDEAVVDFGELQDGEELKPTGGVRLRVADGALVGLEGAEGNEGLVERLWAAYQQRHRGLAHLARRQRALLEARQAAVAARGSPGKERAARNAPCPCGSGQKYKRCCLDADLAAQPGPPPASGR